MYNRLFKMIAVTFFVITGHGTGLVQSAIGQEIGTKLPDLKIDGVVLSGDKKSTISDLYKKGGLIINFWATWCTPCIKEQKLLDSLTQIYPNLSVLSTTYEDSALVRKHFERIGYPKSKLMVVTANDKVLHNLFRHRTIPHNIWIDQSGVIKASTGGDEINEKNIKEFFIGNMSKLYTKSDDIDFDFTKTYHVPDSMILFRSYITAFNEGITSGMNYGAEKNGEFKRFFAWNRPIPHFFWLAFVNQENARMNWNLIELKSADSTRFMMPSMNRTLFDRSRYNNGEDFITRERKWNSENLYCYELILSRSASAKLSSEYMFPDLERFFNVKASTKKKRITSYVVSLGRSKRMKLPAATGEEASVFRKNGVLKVCSSSINKILTFLSQNFYDDIPYTDETGYNGLLTFEINNKSGKLTLEEVWSKLNEFGLSRVKKKRSHKVLVLEDLSHPQK